MFFLLGVIYTTYSQIGINTSSPKAKLDIVAIDEAASTNEDGLLIPRVASFPVTDPTIDQNGMMLYLTTTAGINLPGIYTWNWDIVTSTGFWDYFPLTLDTHYIGEYFGGGIVFYVYNNGQNGLIASLDDLDGGNGVAWSGNTSSLIGGAAQSRYDGKSNTVAIVANNATPNRAATLCDTYSGNGYTDWYLPADWELVLLYNTSYTISTLLENDGDPLTKPITIDATDFLHAKGNYWSSTEYSAAKSMRYMMSAGVGGVYDVKTRLCLVRAVRSF